MQEINNVQQLADFVNGWIREYEIKNGGIVMPSLPFRPGEIDDPVNRRITFVEIRPSSSELAKWIKPPKKVDTSDE